jgi:hypothetical protein
MSVHKRNLNYFLLKFFPLIIFIFSPKIDLISIPGFWQGIRLDDIIILFYSIYFLFSNNLKVYPNLINHKIFGFNWIIFFPYMVLSMIVGKIFEINPNLIIIIRYCEYIALIIILNQLDPSKDKILFLFKLYIFINFFVVLLQYFDLIGGFTSRGGCSLASSNEMGVSRCYDKEDIKSICFLNCNYDFMKNYLPAGNFLLKRVPGITGGPWELSVNLAISLFGLMLFEKNLKKLIPYIFMVLIMMIIGQSRGIIIGFLSSLFFVSNDYKKTFKLFIGFLIFLTLIYFFNILNFQQIINDKFLLDYVFLFKMLISSFSGNVPPFESVKGTGLESMHERAILWQYSFADLKKSNIFLFFGTGGGVTIYNESLIIRVITSFGLIGVLISFYLIRKLPFFFIIFIFVTGITIDLFISFKIFLFSYLILFLCSKYSKEIIKR